MASWRSARAHGQWSQVAARLGLTTASQQGPSAFAPNAASTFIQVGRPGRPGPGNACARAMPREPVPFPGLWPVFLGDRGKSPGW